MKRLYVNDEIRLNACKREIQIMVCIAGDDDRLVQHRVMHGLHVNVLVSNRLGLLA